MKKLVLGAFALALGVFLLTGPSTAGAQATSSCFVFNNDLSVGMTFGEVLELQKFLAAEGSFTVEMTGTFGPLTKSALAQYQSKNGIQATGYFGPATRARVNADCGQVLGAFAQATVTAPSKISAAIQLVTPYEGTTWQIGNSHTISWTPNRDNPNVKAYFETKRNGVYTKFAEIVACQKGSIVWCGDIDTTPTDGVDNWSSATPGKYFVSIVDTVTGSIARTKNEIKLVDYGDVIKLNATAHLDKNKRVEGISRSSVQVTVKKREIVLSWAANADSCKVQIAPDDSNPAQEDFVNHENLKRHVTKQAFRLPGNYRDYYATVVCQKGSNYQTMQFDITVEGAVKPTTLRVDTPNGGEQFSATDAITVGWYQTYSSNETEITLYNVESGVTYYQNTGKSTDGRQAETIDLSSLNIPTGDYRIAVCDLSRNGISGKTLCDQSDTAFSITKSTNPSIVITDSAGNQGITVRTGETFTLSGTPRNLEGLEEWTGTGLPYGNYYTRAYFFSPMFDGSCGNNESSTDGPWTITCTPKTSGKGEIYIVIYKDGKAYTSNTVEVTVEGPSIEPSIKVLSPNGGETLGTGNTYTIEWEAQGLYEFDVVLDARWERGGPDIYIARNVRGNTLSWTVPNNLILSTDSYPPNEGPEMYKIFVMEANGAKEVVGDYSDEYFDIVDGAIKGGACSFTRDLTLGSSGSDVVDLQTILEARGFLQLPAGVAMGYFGATTQTALAQFQASVGIYPDGYFGPVTRAYIGTVGCDTEYLKDEIIQAKLISKDTDLSDPDDSIGEFSFELDLTAVNNEMYVRTSVGRATSTTGSAALGYGFAAIVTDGNNNIVNTGQLTFAVDSQIDPDSNNLVLIPDSATSKFFVKAFYNPTLAGTYKVQLVTINYGLTNGYPNKIVYLRPESTYMTNAIYINNPVSARGASVSALTANTAAYSHIASIPNLSVGMTDPGVASIQRFLNANGFKVNASAGQPGSVGYESNTFGPATQKALAAFQISKGISPANGAFGPQTRAAMTQ